MKWPLDQVPFNIWGSSRLPKFLIFGNSTCTSAIEWHSTKWSPTLDGHLFKCQRTLNQVHRLATHPSNIPDCSSSKEAQPLEVELLLEKSIYQWSWSYLFTSPWVVVSGQGTPGRMELKGKVTLKKGTFGRWCPFCKVAPFFPKIYCLYGQPNSAPRVPFWCHFFSV